MLSEPAIAPGSSSDAIVETDGKRSQDEAQLGISPSAVRRVGRTVAVSIAGCRMHSDQERRLIYPTLLTWIVLAGLFSVAASCGRLPV
jgi:hypothetical protein